MVTPEEERQKLGFLLPGLIGKPTGLTDKEGNILFPSDQKIPPDSFIFFIPIKKWQEISKIRR